MNGFQNYFHVKFAIRAGDGQKLYEKSALSNQERSKALGLPPVLTASGTSKDVVGLVQFLHHIFHVCPGAGMWYQTHMRFGLQFRILSSCLNSTATHPGVDIDRMWTKRA